MDDFTRLQPCLICSKLTGCSIHGLCRECTFAGPRVIEKDPLDSALRWSYPPAALEIVRRFHIAYPGCPDCRGMGRIDKGENAQGCPRCASQFTRHPLRAWFFRRRAMIARAEKAVLTEASALAGQAPNTLEAEQFWKEASTAIRQRAETLQTILGRMTEQRRQLLVASGKGNGRAH